MIRELRDQLDDAIVSLREFKDSLDRLDDQQRDAIFALAWSEHPDFEILITELGTWSERMESLRTAEHKH